ncbi:MAG: HDIG domain-containing metalloprotein [Candidatus Dormibacteria bacterium]|jgi:ribonuclease Y
MAAALFTIAALLVVGTIALVLAGRARGVAGPVAAPPPSVTQVRTQAAAIVSAARTEALAVREAVAEEVGIRRAALEAGEAALAERERTWRDRRAIFDERRFAHRKRREEIEARDAEVEVARAEVRRTIAERAAADLETARGMVLEKLDAELEAERAERVAQLVADRTGEQEATARMLLVEAVERQSESHVDTAPRLSPIDLDGLDEPRRERILTALQVVAESTGTDLGIDNERGQATLRGLDPVGREIARQASLEVLDRSIQAADVAPLVVRTRRRLSATIAELGERALWEMAMEGRPELAELLGVLHYRFSYGQNALLHCKETGYLCGVLAAELGLPQASAREAGALHDIGKAVDHDVEGSHAIIGGELLLVMGTDPAIAHAVKAHHFDVEPSTDLAMLTICADAISASRPGARRDTLAAYLARLEQLQGIATRHPQVERAFPLQAGREVRIFVKAGQVADPEMPALSGEIAREIESEMQYPGVIKVTLIRETQAIATAPVQVGRSVEPLEPVLAGAANKRRRRRRKRKGAGDGEPAGPSEAAGSDDVE